MRIEAKLFEGEEQMEGRMHQYVLWLVIALVGVVVCGFEAVGKQLFVGRCSD